MDFTSLVAVMSPITIGFEGEVAWMYLDSRANVTTGVGQLLSTLEDALVLPWYTIDGGANGSHSSTRNEIAFAFAKVAKMAPGMPALGYRFTGCPMLADVDISHILQQDLIGVASELSAIFPQFPEWPIQAQLAFLDMSYNLGNAKLRREYVKLIGAASMQDWNGCANQCHRNGIQLSRNSWTFAQFMAAKGSTANVG